MAKTEAGQENNALEEKMLAPLSLAVFTWKSSSKHAMSASQHTLLIGYALRIYKNYSAGIRTASGMPLPSNWANSSAGSGWLK